MKRKALLLTIVIAMLASFMTACGRPAQDNTISGDGPIVVKIGHTDSSSRSTHRWSEWLGEYLEEKAPGKFEIEVYPDGQLGDSPDLIAGVKLGTLDVAFDLSSVISSAAGEKSGCIDLPYLYPTYEDWEKGTFENGGLELYNEILEESGYHCLGMYYNGMRQVISASKNYHSAADLKGQKIRIAQNELDVQLWKAMGGNPTPMAWGEVITSLSQGTINALDHSLGVFNDFSLHEIAPYVTLTNHASSPFPIICSKDWIESMPEDLREVFEAGITEMCENQRNEERENEFKYIERFEAEGATVEKLTDAEIEAYMESVKPVYEMWTEKVGQDVMDKWLATVPEK